MESRAVDRSSDASQPAVSAVLAAYSDDRWENLTAAIDSVWNQTYPASEVIVVVDGNEGLLKRLREARPEVRALVNEQAPGAGGARNTGVAAASGDVIAFLDDDAEADTAWLERMIPAFSDPSVLGIGGHLEPRWSGARPGWFPDEFLWVVGCSYPGLPERLAPVRNLIAASMLMRRRTFMELGGFQEGFGKSGARSGTEETELCIRASQSYPGGVWLHEPMAHAWHAVPPGRMQFSYFVTRCRDEGLAKADVTDFVGVSDGLSSERRYVVRVLPSGFFRGLREFIGGDPDGLRRALAIAIGLLCTAGGYLTGRLRNRR